MGALLKELHPYVELGIGYRDEGGRPVGLLVMHYLNAREAKADLVPRRSLAQNGFSSVDQRPYRDVLFTVASAAVAGSDLVLQLHPVGNKPQHLFEMADNRDMLFAACPPTTVQDRRRPAWSEGGRANDGSTPGGPC